MSDLDTGFLSHATYQIKKASKDIDLCVRLLEARENYRELEKKVRETKPGSDRSIANEKKCEALAIVLDLENQIKSFYGE